MRSHQYGVTLMELMTVVSIISILSAIAYPSYRQIVIRGKRADAKVALQQNAQALESCFTRFHSYNDAANCTVLATLRGAGIPSSDGNYLVKAALAGGLADPDLEFALTATPQNGQAADAECGNFTLNQANVKKVSGPKPAAECWR